MLRHVLRVYDQVGVDMPEAGFRELHLCEHHAALDLGFPPVTAFHVVHATVQPFQLVSEAGLVVAEGEGDEFKFAVVPVEESADVSADEVTSVPGTARAVSISTPEGDHPK